MITVAEECDTFDHPPPAGTHRVVLGKSVAPRTEKDRQMTRFEAQREINSQKTLQNMHHNPFELSVVEREKPMLDESVGDG